MLLIYDGYRGHLSLAVLELFERNNISFYVLRDHTPGKTQPLDAVLFSVFESRFQNLRSLLSGFEAWRSTSCCADADPAEKDQTVLFLLSISDVASIFVSKI